MINIVTLYYYNGLEQKNYTKDAQKMMDAYAKVYAPKEEPKPETEATAESEAPADTAETDK